MTWAPVRVTVRVPATAANLGPGFDMLALALQLQAEVRAEPADAGQVSIDPGPEAPEDLRDPARNFVTVAYMGVAEALGVPCAPVRFTCRSGIPVARGLGSSAAASLAGTLVAVAMHQAPWDENQVLRFVDRLEGHRDNAAAALLGGLAICAPGVPAMSMQVPDELRAVVYMPDTQLQTATARKVVPGTFTRDQAMYNAGRCALLVRALALGDMAHLTDAMDDVWHQPERTALIPWARPVIAAAQACGAGAALAGAGPSVIALTSGDTEPLEQAMRAAAEAYGAAGSCKVLRPRNYGTRVDVKP